MSTLYDTAINILLLLSLYINMICSNLLFHLYTIHTSILSSISYLFIYPYIHSSIHASMCQSISPFIHSPIHLISYTASLHPAIMHLYITWAIHLSIHILPSICPSSHTYPLTHPSIQLFIHNLSYIDVYIPSLFLFQGLQYSWRRYYMYLVSFVDLCLSLRLS